MALPAYWREPFSVRQRSTPTSRYVSHMNDHDERELMEDLDRQVSRKGSLFALIACLAIATGLAVAAAVAMVPIV